MPAKNPLAEALLQAVDVLRHCVVDGPGCDDAAVRKLAIADGEVALREAGFLGQPKPAAPIAEGYGVKVRKTEVRCDDGLSLIDEYQVLAKDPDTGRYRIVRRYSFELEARAEAIRLRAIRKANGVEA